LAVEVKNAAKAMLLSFNTTAVFLHDIMETTFLKRGSAVGMFGWVTLSSDCWFELQVEWIKASR